MCLTLMKRRQKALQMRFGKALSGYGKPVKGEEEALTCTKNYVKGRRKKYEGRPESIEGQREASNVPQRQ